MTPYYAQLRYAYLVNRIREKRGLAALPNVLPLTDPWPFIRQMEQELGEDA